MNTRGGVSRFRDNDVAFLYVTGVFAVLISLIPFFRSAPRFPYMLPMWTVLYLLYRWRLIPERFKFVAGWLFLAGSYIGLGTVTATFAGEYHGADVLRFETGLFGVLPSRWIQSYLAPANGCPNWFDYPLAVLHGLFFLFPLCTPYLVLRKRGVAAMKRVMLAFAFISSAGYLTYVLWPLTPPWLLAVDGVIPPIRRCVFEALHRITPAFLVSGASNTPRAAMPSLHAGVTMLMALVLQKETGWRFAWWAWLVLLLICFEIVYGAEHFLVDIAAGFIYAVAAYVFSYRRGFGP